MIDRDGPNVHELGQIVFVRHIVPVPGHYIERRVILGTLESLTT